MRLVLIISNGPRTRLFVYEGWSIVHEFKADVPLAPEDVEFARTFTGETA